MTRFIAPLPPTEAKLKARAHKELARWQRTLTRKARAKLVGEPLSKWAREGGSSIIVPRRKWRRRKGGGKAKA